MDDYARDLEKWKILIGGFILSFGDIEAITYRLWECYCRTDIALAPQQFGDRASKIIGAMKESSADREIIDLLIAAKKLADKRNSLAHNPVQVQVYQHTENGALWAELGLQCRKSGEFIDDLELIELESAARDIVAQLYMRIGFA